MTINIANPFKSQATRTFDKSKIGQDVHTGEYFPPTGVNLYSRKKIFEFGTATTVVDDNLSKAKPLERVVSRTTLANYRYLTRPSESSPIFVALRCVCGYPREEAEEDSFQGQVSEG